MNWHSIATYNENGQGRLGVVVDNMLYDLHRTAEKYDDLIALCQVDNARQLLEDWAAYSTKIATLANRIAEQGGEVVKNPEYMVPFQPRRIFGAASNFYEHADEMGTELAPRSESQPYIFMKAETSVVSTKANVIMPAQTERLDWEVELAAVIGTSCRNVAVEDALDVVAAYTVLNDISARDLNRRNDYPFKHDWFRGKSFDTFGPVGPWIVPAECIDDPQNLRLGLKINGEVKQDGNTSRMIFSLAEQIAYLSNILTLMPGDIIATGTPEGVGMGSGIYLKPGDTMIAWIEGIGELENTVIAEK